MSEKCPHFKDNLNLTLTMRNPVAMKRYLNLRLISLNFIRKVSTFSKCRSPPRQLGGQRKNSHKSNLFMSKSHWFSRYFGKWTWTPILLSFVCVVGDRDPKVLTKRRWYLLCYIYCNINS